MLKSLFGDLGSPEDPFERRSTVLGEPAERAAGFAARATMESVATEVNERGQMIDRHLRELVVSGSAAHAMREHFNATRTDADPSTRLVTLFDPSRIWASAVVKALSDAGGMPIERLHLRDQASYGTLALIERTVVVRRFDDAIKVYHADVRAPGAGSTEIPFAMMERSHLAAVVIGSMRPDAIDDMLVSLCSAATDPHWRCPAVLFLLPPNAVWIANKIAAIGWPSALHIEVRNEPLTSASAVWNAVLGAWDRVKNLQRWGSSATLDRPEEGAEFVIKVADLERGASRSTASADDRRAAESTSDGEWHDTMAPLADPADSMEMQNPLPPPRSSPQPGLLDPLRAQLALRRLLATSGVLACALVDSMSGLAIAQDARPDHQYDIETAVAASAQVLRAHRLAARSVGMTSPIDEVIVTTGDYQQLIHRVARHQDLYIFVLLDRHQINLALGRLKILEAEKSFA